MRRWKAGWVLLALTSACTSTPPPPGNEVMGTFNFNAHVDDGGTFPPTTLAILDGGFSFVGTLSRNKPKAKDATFYPAFLTVNGFSRDAGWDGQYLTSVAQAPRVFDFDGGCNCGEGVQVTETLRLVLLSATQAQATNELCPPKALDGGVPAPGGTIKAPDTLGSRFDAQLACGTLVDDYAPGSGCTCAAGSVSYAVTGTRPQ